MTAWYAFIRVMADRDKHGTIGWYWLLRWKIFNLSRGGNVRTLGVPNEIYRPMQVVLIIWPNHGESLFEVTCRHALTHSCTTRTQNTACQRAGIQASPPHRLEACRHWLLITDNPQNTWPRCRNECTFIFVLVVLLHCGAVWTATLPRPLLDNSKYACVLVCGWTNTSSRK